MNKRKGYFGQWGGAFIPEVLHQTFVELNQAYQAARKDDAFWQEYLALMRNYSCRPTPLTYAANLSEHFGGGRIFIKREDLNHTGAHKANNVMGQGLLVKRMGKKRVIAETGAGQHGVATATMAARFGLECTIYMGEEDVMRQRPNVFWMEKLGATVVPVTAGSRTLKDAINEAFRDWVTRHGRYPLCDGHGLRPPPLSGDGRLVPVDHRQRGPGADPRPDRQTAGPGLCLRRRWLQRHGHLSGISR